jgi:hypothetical protein
MTANKLFALLVLFSRYELQGFRKYLLSPWHNENQDLLKLFEIYLSFLPFKMGESEAQIEKKTIWKLLFEAKAFDDQLLRRLHSELTQHALQFVALRQYKQDAARMQIDLLPFLGRLDLPKHFAGIERQLREYFAETELRNADFHQALHKLELACHHRQEQSGTKAIDYVFLEKADYHLDSYYIIQKLKHYCDTLDYRNTLSLQAEVFLFPDFLQTISQSRYFEEPAVEGYFLVANMLLKPEDESYFQGLKNLLQLRAARFAPLELRSLYIYLFNYCIDYKINRGQSEYFHFLFELYQKGLEQGILFKEGVLPTQDYKNIITVGLHVGAYPWVEQFINTHTTNLPAADQENATNYNLAKVFFHQRRYQQVIEQLQEVEYQDIVYALGSKLMLLKTYYELNEFLALDSLVDSFRVFLQRNKTIAKEVKQQYLNVLRFVKKLSNTLPRDKGSLEAIKKQILECKALADKAWILEKLAELEGEQ